MARRFPIGRRIALASGALTAILLASMGVITVNNLRTTISGIVSGRDAQIIAARGDEVGQLIDTLKWELTALSLDPTFADKDHAKVASYLRRYEKALSPEVAVFFVGWPDGSYCTSGGASGNISDRDYYKALFERGESWFIGSPVVSKSLGVPVIPMALARKAADGSTIGFVAFSIKLDTLTKIASDIQLGATGYGWMVDGQGMVIAHPAEEMVMTLDVTKGDEKGYRGLSALGNAMLREESGSGTFSTPKGEEYFSVFARVPFSPNWVLGANVTTAEIRKDSDALARFVSLFTLGALAVAIVLSYLIGRSIVRPIRKLVGNFKELSEGDGDLTVTIKAASNDELGDLAENFNTFIIGLKSLVTNLKEAQGEMGRIGRTLRVNADESVEAVMRINQSAREVGERAQLQAESVQGASAAVTQIASNIDSLDQQIADQAASVSEASASIEEMVGNIASVTTSIAKMADSFSALLRAAEAGKASQEATAARILSISQRSQALLETNKVIAKIASQTNLLAMNAAIEAAHAGEAGQGFSVVADEIRNLASTSASQSRTIGQELSTIGKEIEAVVATSKESAAAFTEVAQKIEVTDTIVREVESAMLEQKEGSAQILEALKSLNEITTSVQAGSREMSAGNATVVSEMEGLKSLAEEIQRSMESMEEGGGAISQSAQKVSDMADETQLTIRAMEDGLGRFKV